MIEKTALNYDEIVAVAIEEAIEIGDLASDVERLSAQRNLGPFKGSSGARTRAYSHLWPGLA